MIQIFTGKTAVYVSCPYSVEHSCKKAKRSYDWFSVTFGHGQTHGPKTGSLTSTEVENCNVPLAHAQRQNLTLRCVFADIGCVVFLCGYVDVS